MSCAPAATVDRVQLVQTGHEHTDLRPKGVSAFIGKEMALFGEPVLVGTRLCGFVACRRSRATNAKTKDRVR